MAARRERYGLLVQVIKTKIRMEGLCFIVACPPTKFYEGVGWSYWKQASLIVERREEAFKHSVVSLLNFQQLTFHHMLGNFLLSFKCCRLFGKQAKVLRDQGCKRAAGIESHLVIMFVTCKFCVQLVICRTNSVMGRGCFLKDKVLCVRECCYG